MNPMVRWLIRAVMYPSHGFNLFVCALGVWRRWDWIDDHVLLGMRPGRRDIARLRDIGIRAIVNMCEEFPGWPSEMAACGIEQLHLPTLDFTAPAEEDLVRGLEFIRRQAEQSRKTLVHCKAGRGRAATLAVCYVMATRGVPASEAFAIVRSKRRQVDGRLDRRPVVRAIEARLRLTARPTGPRR